jgi:hypothetical protein
MYQIVPFIYLAVVILPSQLIEWRYETVVQIVFMCTGALLPGTSANVPLSIYP